MDEDLVIEGWKERKMGTVPMAACPHCGNYEFGYHIVENEMAKCCNCNKKFHKGKINWEDMKAIITVCKVCGIEIPLISEHLDFMGSNSYICYKCRNHVAVKYRNTVIQPKTVLNVKWNKDIKERSMKVDNELHFTIVKKDKDKYALKLMQLIGKHEDTGFLYYREGTGEGVIAGLLFDESKYIGYMMWTEHGGEIVARQIFVMKDERRKGYGTKMHKFWFEKIAEGRRFGAETPNKISCKILEKLGYAKNEKDKLKGVKCYFVNSL